MYVRRCFVIKCTCLILSMNVNVDQWVVECLGDNIRCASSYVTGPMKRALNAGVIKINLST